MKIGLIPMGRVKRLYAVYLMLLLLLLGFTFVATLPAQAQNPQPDDLIKGVKFEQRLNEQIPLKVTFRDETGRPVQVGDYFGQKPVILVFAYYECPMLCTLVLNGLVTTLQAINFDVGDQFNVVTISINPKETPDLAMSKKETYLQAYDRPGAAAGWHFLTGDQDAIQQLTRAVGFYYAYDPTLDQYAHPTGIMILTPQGKLSRYFYGIDFPAGDVRLGLVEASTNKIGSPTDQLLLLCYHYDPLVGKYSLTVMNIVRLLGLTTVLALGLLVVTMLRRDRRQNHWGSTV